MPAQPHIVIIAGPNGAGKTTIARDVVSQTIGVTEFVNADTIAAGLSGFAPERAAFAAGRVMLARLRELAADRATFAFESTLASRTLAPWLREQIANGYQIDLIYVWLASAQLAIRRVRTRIRMGGHAVPEDVIRRRYDRSIANLINTYLPLAQAAGSWRIYDNSRSIPEVIAFGTQGRVPTIMHQDRYSSILEIARGQQAT